jgi:sulfate transporter 4
VFSKLPYNVIGAIIIVGVCQLIEFGVAYHLFKTHVRDFIVWLVAFIGTAFLGVELGLGISIGLALLIVIFETAFPHMAVLGQVNNSSVYRCAGMRIALACVFLGVKQPPALAVIHPPVLAVPRYAQP